MNKKTIKWITRVLVIIHICLFLILPFQVVVLTAYVQTHVEVCNNISCGYYFEMVTICCIMWILIELIFLSLFTQHKITFK